MTPTGRRLARGALLFAAVTAFAATAATAQTEDAPRAVEIAAEPVPLDPEKPERARFGALEWLGTLELSAAGRDFGGFSGLAVDAAGKRLVAVSDIGRWLTAEIVASEGHAEGLAGARLGRLRNRDGEPLDGKREADAEAIAFAEAGAITGEAYIAFERDHRIVAARVTGEGVGGTRRRLRLPGEMGVVAPNGGLEAIAMLHAGPSKGRLLAMTEKHVDDDGNHVGWLLGGETPEAVRLKRMGGFAVTGMTVLPEGDVIVLERRFRFTEGVKMRIRRVPAGAVRPGARLEGEVLLEADNRLEIDNMEGIAAHRDAAGRAVLTVVSDDNFNAPLQRTLLMRFALAE